MGIGMLAGLALSGPAAQAATSITATLSSQSIYVDGQRVAMTAYSIRGNNYVRLRDIGKAVDFGVIYDAATNSVYINSNQSYQKESAPTASPLSEETVRAAILALKKVYPHGAEYPTPYRPNAGLSRPYTNCDHCAGWAMLCSDAAFGDLPWRRVDNPRWEDIRVGDVIDYRNEQSGHAIVVIEKTAEYVKVTESGMNNHARWGGQYPRWWLEQQSGYCLNTRYPE
ncbi:MAG: hypothetical protein HDT33_01925 [Clostridiales bacterium]|nr:hypothetical protein [Clostridiales bacterium]